MTAQANWLRQAVYAHDLYGATNRNVPELACAITLCATWEKMSVGDRGQIFTLLSHHGSYTTLFQGGNSFSDKHNKKRRKNSTVSAIGKSTSVINLFTHVSHEVLVRSTKGVKI